MTTRMETLVRELLLASDGLKSPEGMKTRIATLIRELRDIADQMDLVLADILLEQPVPRPGRDFEEMLRSGELDEQENVTNG